MTGPTLLAVAGSAALVAIAAVFAWIARADRRRAEEIHARSAQNLRHAATMREDTARWISQTNPQFWGEL